MALIGKMMYSELQSIANGIGKYHDGSYVKEQDATDCVRDLIKSLRRENETCDIRRFLGLAQVLQEDLIPLISNYGLLDEELFEVTVRCLMNLTQPARIVFKNEVPQDKTTRHCYMETESYLQSYKQSFVNNKFLQVLSEKLANLLELNWEERSEDQNVLIERILVLLRNILHVPATDVDRLRTDDDASTHDQVIWNMHQTGLDKLILYVASSDDERRFCVHVLEIISLMFRDQTPEQLASAGASRSRRETERDEQELAKEADMERARKRAQLFRLTPRHSRFGGTFVMKGMKSISDKDLICHKPLTADIKQHTFDSGKRPRKKHKNRKPIEGDECTRRSTLSIRVSLKEFCIEFIKNCYNPLMRSVKSALDRDSTQENDETYYLWSMRFFMQFQRLYHFDVELVRETMSIQDFHYVHTIMLNHQDMIVMEKKESIIWGKRLHLALRTYRELLETLQSMSSSPSMQVRDSANVIQQNVFYLQEYREILTVLLKKFNNTRQSKLFAKDLVETTHLYVRAMEKWCASQGKVLVQKKKRQVVRRKKKPVEPLPPPPEPQLSQDELEDRWDGIAESLSELLQDLEEVEEEVTPFDATSDVSIDEQRLECVRSIHEAMHTATCEQAVALLRAAREVWPDNEEFGAADITPEDEFMMLREVFFADIPRRQRPAEIAAEDDGDLNGGYDEVVEEEMEGMDEEEVTQEQEFDFKNFLVAFSSPKAIQVYSLLLTLYKTNDVHTNHCIVKMLHRITVQLSLFKTFQKIFNDECTKTAQFSEMKTFALYVVRQFFKCAEKNPKVYVEMLFWKNMKECFELMEGYGSYAAPSTKAAAKVSWTEEQEMELRQLYEEHKGSDGDLVDKILANLIDSTRSRRQVIRQLIVMDLVTDSKQLKKGVSGRPVWTEQEIERLKDLYELHRSDQDPAGEIMVKMNKPRRQIVSKLVEVGAVEDRNLLRKRRGKKSRKTTGSGDEDPVHIGGREDDDSESSSGESDNDEASVPTHPYSDLTRGDPQELLAQLREMPNMDYCISWIQRSLSRTADDREDEDEEPDATPIIPLMEESEAALLDTTFQRFLYSIGINPPTDEQEQFWRISLELDPQKLRQVASALDKNSPEDFPQLMFKYTIPTGTRTAKPKKPKKAKVKRSPPRKPTRNDVGLARPPVSKEFVTTSESDSDSELRLRIDEGPAPEEVDFSRTRDRAHPSHASSDSDGDKENLEGNVRLERHVPSEGRRSGSAGSPSQEEATPSLPPTARQSSGSSAEQDRVHMADADSVSGEEEEGGRSESPPFESFPATALTQQHLYSSDSDDDHVTIARAVQGKKRKAGVLSSDED